jgi:hypothetical protein
MNQGHAQIQHTITDGQPKFYTRSVAENGETLSHSEILGDRQTAINNIQAHLNLFGGASVLVKDINTDREVIGKFTLSADGTIQVIP